MLDSLHAAERALKTLRNFRAKLATKSANGAPNEPRQPTTCDRRGESTRRHRECAKKIGVEDLFAALHDDLNTPAALGTLFTLVNQGADAADAPSLADFDRALFALGLDLSEAQNTDSATPEVPAEITALAEQRWAAKLAKDWETADALRAQIAALGWAMRDRKDGYSLEPQT